MEKLSYNDKLRMQTPWQVSQFHCLVYAERLSHCGRLDGRLSQFSPFVRVQLEMMAFSSSPSLRSVCIQYSQLDMVKTMGIRGKINDAI